MTERATARSTRPDRAGQLVLCATPIGNLGDLSPRMIECLATADRVVAEDTRRTRKLLSHAGISASMTSYHKGNQVAQDDRIIEMLHAGLTIALVTDAGMPTISDPGGDLVRRCADEGITVDCVPGPSAVVTALAVSGLETDRFVFEGFLPRSGAQRTRRLGQIASEERTTVIFEAPHRMRLTLASLLESVGPTRRISVCRELTKIHQEVRRSTVAEAAEYWSSVDPRGEFVIVIEGAADAPVDEDEQRELIRQALSRGASTRDAAAVATGLARKRAYALALEIAREDGT